MYIIPDPILYWNDAATCSCLSVCLKDSRVAVQIDKSNVLIYVDDMTVTQKELDSGKLLKCTNMIMDCALYTY